MVQVGSTRLVIPVSVLPEDVTLGLFAPAGANISQAHPVLPVSLRFLSDDITSTIAPDDLLTMLTTNYPDIPSSILNRSWFNGSPFLGRSVVDWPSGVYHFPGLTDGPPITVLPTTSLVTTPFLAQANTFTMGPPNPVVLQQPFVTRASHSQGSATATGPTSFPSAAMLQPIPHLSLADPDLVSADDGAFQSHTQDSMLPWSLSDEDPNRLTSQLLAVADVVEAATLQLVPTSLATTVSTASPTPASDTTALSSPQSSAPRTSARPPTQQPSSHSVSRPRSGKRPGSGSSEGKPHKRRSYPSSHSKARKRTSPAPTRDDPAVESGYSRSTDHGASSSDPILSATSARQSSQPVGDSGVSAPQTVLGFNPQVISSESSDVDDAEAAPVSTSRR